MYPNGMPYPGNGSQNLFYQAPYGSHINPPTTVGITHTGNIPQFRNPTFSEVIQMKYPNGGVQLLPLLNKVSRGTTKQLSETYMVKTQFIPKLLLAEVMPAARRGSQTTVKVVTANGIIPGMTFVTGAFGEQVMVSDVLGEHEIVMIRGLSAVIPREVAKGVELIYSGDVFEEGSQRPLMRSSGASEFMVHTQIVRHSWGLTNTVRESLLAQDAKSGGITGVTASDSKQEAMLNHAYALESFLLFGKHSFRVHNGMPMRTASGILEFISANAPQNIITAAGKIGIADLGKIFGSLSDISINGMMNGSRELYVHQAVIDTVTAIAASQGLPTHQVNAQTDIMGRQYTKFSTPKATFNLIQHPRFDMERSMYGAALAIDPSSFMLKYLGSRDTQHQYYNADASGNLSPIGDPTGLDQSGGTFTTELMLICRNPSANGMYFNLLESKPSFNYCCK